MLDLEIEKIYFSIQTDNNIFSNKIYKILHEITRNSNEILELYTHRE